MAEPNEWGVTFDVTDAEIDADLQRWDWGWPTIDRPEVIQLLNLAARSAAKLVLEMIAEQTMADIDEDGTINMGLFEHNMPLKVGLPYLVQHWIDQRADWDTGQLEGDEETAGAAQLADLLQSLADKLRAAAQPKREMPSDA